MLLAHLSDPHVLDLRGVPTHRMLFNKRVTGWVNLKLHRGHKHRPAVFRALLDDVRAQSPDHVAITGDVTNLSLEPEFEAFRAMLDGLAMSPSDVSVVPGNHDVYTEGARRAGRFASYLGAYGTSDLDVGTDHAGGRFPFVRLRGAVALVGLCSAVPRAPLVASGHLGDAQRAALRGVLAHPEVASRVPVVLAHHPVRDPHGALASYLRGLDDRDAFAEDLAQGRDVLALHGHWHRRGHERIASAGAVIHRLGATSASLVHDDADRMAGYNLYEIDADRGLVSARARVWNPSTERFDDAALPDGASQRG